MSQKANKMTKILSISLAVVISLTRVVTAHAAPVVAADQPNCEFGTISQGEKVERTFIIRNMGNEPLIIKSVTPSCGCVEVTTSASVIAPGTYGEIKATFDSAAYSGAFQKTVAVETNDPTSPSSLLNLNGTIIEKFRVVPEHINLGEVRVDVLHSSHITVTNTGNKPLKLTAITTTPPRIVAVADKKLLPPGESGTITVSVTPRKGDRLVSGIITITTDNPDKPEVKVSLYGSLVN